MPAFVKLLGMKWVPCGAHLMNLVVNSGLKLVANLIDRASYLVRFFKKSVQMNDLLVSTHQALTSDDSNFPTLKQRNNTRWNSVYDMLHSLSSNAGKLKS